MARIIKPDGEITTISPKNKTFFTNDELSEIIGTKSWQITIPKSHRAKVYIYSEVEDDEVNITASGRVGQTLGGIVIECEQSEVDFEY